MKRIRWVHMLLAGAALLLASCTQADTPTSTTPAGVMAVDVSASSLDGDWHAEHERLLDRLHAIRDSLKAERARHREEFREARQRWTEFQRDWNKAKKAGTLPELLACAPQEYTAAAELIGPEGGSIKIGPHELRIPAGALDHEVVISAVAPVSTLVEVQLQPEGLQFATPAKLKLNYSQCVQPPSWLRLFMVYLSDDGRILEITTSRDKKGLKTVVGYLEHFSRYAVAW
jgi:hypothetical protein